MTAFLIRYWRFIAPVLALVALYIAFRSYVASEVEQASVEAAAHAAKVDAIADDVAGQIAASEAARTEQENSNAREAAARSDDPLGDGLRSLRAGKAGNSKATD